MWMRIISPRKPFRSFSVRFSSAVWFFCRRANCMHFSNDNVNESVIYDNMQWKIYHYWLLSYRSMGQFVRISPASNEIERFTWFNEWIIHIWHCKAIFAPERKIVYSIINESKLFLEIIVQRLHWEKWIILSAVSVYSGLFI